MIKFFNKLLKSQKGFTLIELIVVIAILGILAAIAVPRLGGFQTTAKKNADISNARLIANAASVAISDGTTVSSAISNVAVPSPLSKFLDAWPEVKLKSGEYFHMDITDDSVKVFISTATSPTKNDTTQVYPKPANVSGNKWYE